MVLRCKDTPTWFRHHFYMGDNFIRNCFPCVSGFGGGAGGGGMATLKRKSLILVKTRWLYAQFPTREQKGSRKSCIPL